MSDHGEAAAAYKANQPLPTPSFAPPSSCNLPSPSPLDSGSTNTGIGFNNDHSYIPIHIPRNRPDPSPEPQFRDYSSDRWVPSLIPIGQPSQETSAEGMINFLVDCLRLGLLFSTFLIPLGLVICFVLWVFSKH